MADLVVPENPVSSKFQGINTSYFFPISRYAVVAQWLPRVLLCAFCGESDWGSIPAGVKQLLFASLGSNQMPIQPTHCQSKSLPLVF